eukprot:10194370-Alexandrium_andersonii.AAC.1
MAGVLQDSSGFLSYWFDQLHPEDLDKYQAQAGALSSTRCGRPWPSWSASGCGEHCSHARHQCQ